MNNLTGIFKSKLTNDYFWCDCLNEYEIEKAEYFVDESNETGYHASIRSALYDDMTNYIDSLQNEENLSDKELYVVTYFKFEGGSFGLIQEVDFGITKEQIIENVKAQKYVEGASYFTMGNMFYTTKMILEGK